MKASIIIVSWNGADLLRLCLPPLFAAVKHTGVDHEIIVVDDGSQDDSVQIVRNEFPAIKLVALPENHGFGKACNIGVQHSQNPIVVMLNNDMIVEEDFLDPLLSVFDDPEVFASICKVIKWDRQNLDIGLTTADFKFGFIKLNRRAQIKTQDESPMSTFYASGGSVAYSREKYLQLGGFDEIYFPFYWEDTDLSYRAWKWGWKVVYQPRSIAYHKNQGTIGKSFKRNYIKEIYYKNRFIFIWRNITDRRYLAQHLLCLIPHLISTTLIGRLYYAKGFFRALKDISRVKERRRKEKQFYQRSDVEIFSIGK